MAMNKSERDLIARQSHELDRLSLKCNRLLSENNLLRRIVELLKDRLDLSDEEYDNIRRQALED